MDCDLIEFKGGHVCRRCGQDYYNVLFPFHSVCPKSPAGKKAEAQRVARGCCGGDKKKKEEKPPEGYRGPSIAKKASNLFRAVVKDWKAGRPRVDEAEYAARIAVCDGCDWRKGDDCLRCGCSLLLKATWGAEQCPLKKWPGEPNHGG